MTNIKFSNLPPGTVNIPSSNDVNNGGFKDLIQIPWTGSEWRRKDSLEITHGDTTNWNSDTSYSVLRTGNMYNPSDTTGLQLHAQSGSSHKVIYEMYGNSRWMPASVFNGLGFETKFERVAGNSNHDLYLRKYAVIFAHRTTSQYRVWAWDTGNTDRPSGNYRYDKIHSGFADVADIRSWGPDWLFQGIAIWVYNNGGINTTTSKLTVYNLKIGHKYSTVGGQYRYLPLARRAYGSRNMHPDGGSFAVFSDPYV